MNILVVDDEKGFTEVIRNHLEAEQFTVDTANQGAAALDLIRARRYHLIVLDILMPGQDGWAVLKTLRTEGQKTPVIFVTAKAEESDKVKGLAMGADDYITKPFSLAELTARIRSVLRRSAPGSDINRLTLGPCTICFDAATLTRGGKSFPLSRYEVDILRLLASEPGKIFSRDEILDRVWGVDAFPTNRTVDNYIVKLRKKIEDDPQNPARLISVYGAGYKLIPEPEQLPAPAPKSKKSNNPKP